MTQRKQRRTPREKKQLEYTKDFINNAEYPQSFAKSWPRKESITHRSFRRKVRQLNTSLAIRSEGDFPEGHEPEAIRRRIVRKWGVTPMGEVVSFRIATRLFRTAWNFYKQPYDSTHDRERFARFLASVILGRTEYSRRLASLFGQALVFKEPHFYLLQPREFDAASHPWHVAWDRWHNWLQTFLKDEPEWEQRLRDWIDSFDDNA
jgi:hypothetical protein